MIVKKITTGFVVQEFDGKTGKFLRQEFVAGDQVDFEDYDGNPLNYEDIDNDVIICFGGYTPYEMVQPKKKAKKKGGKK